MLVNHLRFQFFHSNRYLLRSVLLLWVALTSASGKCAEAVDSVMSQLDRLSETRKIDTALVESMDAFLSQSHVDLDVNDAEICQRIAIARSLVAHAALYGFGSRDRAWLETADAPCAPEYGVYPFLLASIQFLKGNYTEAARLFVRAQDQLPYEHPRSVDIQLNLSAALHEQGLEMEAISILQQLLDPESRWSKNEKLKDPILQAGLRINAAAMMVTLEQFGDALELLGQVDLDVLPPYWRQIKSSNEFICYEELGRFERADSIWEAVFEPLELSDCSWQVLGRALRSITTHGDIGRVFALRDHMRETPPTYPVEESDYYPFLYDLELTDDQVVFAWRALQAAFYIQQKGSGTPEFNEANAVQALRSEFYEEPRRRDWLSVIGLSLLLTGFSTLVLFVSFRRRLRRGAQGGGMSESPATAEEGQGVVNLTESEIRTLYDGLSMGLRVEDAKMVVRKLELSQAGPKKDLDFSELKKPVGWEELNAMEIEVIRHALQGLPSKEIAHNMGVSAGYVYNARSAIRTKLNIPEDAHFKFWLMRNLF